MVLPLLLVVIAGIVDFGFAFQRFEVITNAAREGARLGTLSNYGSAAIKQRVQDYIKQGLNYQTTLLSTVIPVGSVTVSQPSVTVTSSSGTVTLPVVAGRCRFTITSLC